MDLFRAALLFSLGSGSVVACSLVNAPDAPIAGGTATGTSTSSSGGGASSSSSSSSTSSSSTSSSSSSSASSSGAGGGAPTCGNHKIDPGETCDPPSMCPKSCDDGDVCTTDTTKGSAATCDIACTNTPIDTCTAVKDGCCPANCNGMTDADCTKCGDGFVGPGETCDDGPGSGTPCPQTCDDGIVCTADVMTGSPATCDATCASTPIVVCGGKEGCCPPGCNGSNDADCPSVCGNGIVEPGETCDGNCPASCDDNNVCTADILTGSAAACTAACTNGCGDYINPSPPVNNCAGGPAWIAWQEVPPCSFSATRLSVHTPSGGTVALFLDGGNKPGSVLVQAPLGPADADGWASATFPGIAINGGQTYWIGHFFQGVCSVTAIGATPTEWDSLSGIGGPWMGPYTGTHWTSRLLCN